jgi:hypothetical protein
MIKATELNNRLDFPTRRYHLPGCFFQKRDKKYGGYSLGDTPPLIYCSSTTRKEGIRNETDIGTDSTACLERIFIGTGKKRGFSCTVDKPGP